MSANPRLQAIAQFVQLGGVAAFAAGAVLSVHHYLIGACFIGGAAAYLVGRKLRAL